MSFISEYQFLMVQHCSISGLSSAARCSLQPSGKSLSRSRMLTSACWGVYVALWVQYGHWRDRSFGTTFSIPWRQSLTHTDIFDAHDSWSWCSCGDYTYQSCMGIVMSFIGGVGIGGIIVPAAVILTIISPDEVVATVIAITLSIRLIGRSIGYSIHYNVLQNKVSAYLPTHVAEAAIVAGLPFTSAPAFVAAFVAQNTAALAKIQGVMTAVISAATFAVRESYAYCFKYIYLVSIAFGGTAMICSAFLGDIRKFMTERVAVVI